MSKHMAVMAVLLALSALGSRAAADVPQKPIWEQPADLRIQEKALLFADQPQNQPQERLGSTNDWFIRTSFELWPAAITGSAGNGKTNVDVDAGFDELFENSTFGLGFKAEAAKGHWSFLLHAMWLHLGDDPTASSGGAQADLDGDFGMIDLAAAYQFKAVRVRGQQMLYLDALLGLRYTSVSTSIKITEGADRGLQSDSDKEFVDPYIGLRTRWYISDQFNLTALGAVGGAGVGSDLLLSGELMLEYRFSDTYSLIAGYRAYYYDYDDNFEWNVTMHGPVIAVAIRW